MQLAGKPSSNSSFCQRLGREVTYISSLSFPEQAFSSSVNQLIVLYHHFDSNITATLILGNILAVNMSLHIREPLLPPNHQDGGHGLPTSPGSIQILHPAYDNGASLILSLQGNDTEMGGLALSFALDCCSIVTGNRSDGWLSRHRDPKGPSVATDITILQPNEYYLHLPQRPGKPSMPQKPFLFSIKRY